MTFALAGILDNLAQLTAQRDEALRLLQAKNDATCTWRLDNPDERIWTGECDSPWILEDGDPVQNHMNYCPQCGKRLVVKEATGEREQLP